MLFIFIEKISPIGLVLLTSFFNEIESWKDFYYWGESWLNDEVNVAYLAFRYVSCFPIHKLAYSELMDFLEVTLGEKLDKEQICP